MGVVGWLASTIATLCIASGVYVLPAAVCRLMNLGRRRSVGEAAGQEPTALVLLSGRVEIDARDGRTTTVLATSCLARVREAARIYAMIAPEWVISAGRTRRPVNDAPACAELMRDELIRLGVPAGRILVETESRTTRETAVNVATILRELGAWRTVVVTADVHMPRSLGAFHALNIPVVPAGVTDPDASRAWPAWLLPTAHGLRFSGDVAHELLGLALYRLRGWLS